MIIYKFPSNRVKVKQKEKKTEKAEYDYDTFYEYICDLAKFKYEHEMRREDSIIQQASNMQTAFSFVIIALFTIAPVIVQNRGVLSFIFLLIALSSVAIVLILCLVFATIAQHRKKQATLPTAEEHTQFIENNKNSFVTQAQRRKYMAKIYEELEKSLHSNNGKRIKYVRLSMLFFYISIALCFIWFFIAICKMV